jgi:hypothetical protein
MIDYLTRDLQEILAIEYGDFESAGIEVFDATEINATMTRLAHHFVVRVDTAAAAEVVFRHPAVELVQTEVFVVRPDLEYVYRNGFRAHHRALAGTDRTGTAQTPCYLLTVVGKANGSTMTTAIVIFAHLCPRAESGPILLQCIESG